MATGFVIEDPENWLTKSQREKAKAWLRDCFLPENHETNYQPLLDRLYYKEPCQKYTSVTVTPDLSATGLYRVSFSTSTPSSNNSSSNLRERLRAKLRARSSSRTSVRGKGDDWKMYQRLLQSPAIKMIPAERLDMVLPDPDGVRKQRSNYEQFAKICPDPTLKEYFSLCLEK